MHISPIQKINAFSHCRHLSALVLTLLLVACDFDQSAQRDWVVRVEDHYLSREELAEAIPTELDAADSTKVADAYINQWIKDQVVLVQAELNLPPEQSDFEQQLRDYRNSLVVYAFEKQLIQQKLDTVVSEREIERYYENNAQNFELKDYILRVQFLQVPSDAPKLDQVEEWLRSDDPENIFFLEDYGKQYAEIGFFDDQQWLYLDDLLRQIPIQLSDKEAFLSSNKFVKFTEGNYLYLLKIIDYQRKDGITPLDLLRKDIRNIIVNKRKREFIMQMRNDLLESAKENNEIEYNR